MRHTIPRRRPRLLTTVLGAALSQGKNATASSSENDGTPVGAEVDGNNAARWSSAFSDPQWVQVDLGSSQTICGVRPSWEAAYASAFQIQTSADGSTWTSIYSNAGADRELDGPERPTTCGGGPPPGRRLCGSGGTVSQSTAIIHLIG